MDFCNIEPFETQTGMAFLEGPDSKRFLLCRPLVRVTRDTLHSTTGTTAGGRHSRGDVALGPEM